MNAHHRFAAGLAVLILLIACLGALAGCGGGGDDADPPGQPTPQVNCQAQPAACR